ncbi:MAG TPA: GNAT family N-acetyltransferase [Patescibacteria group bacterium]
MEKDLVANLLKSSFSSGKVKVMLSKEIMGEYIQRTTTTKVWNPYLQPWETIKTDILNIEKSAFSPQVASTEERLYRVFNLTSTSVIFLLNDKGDIVGYTCAYPLSENKTKDDKTAYIESTAIKPDYQGFRLVGKLIGSLEEALKRKGFMYIERDALIDNGYADKITRSDTYKERILESYDWFNTYMQQWQRHFKIRL